MLDYKGLIMLNGMEEFGLFGVSLRSDIGLDYKLYINIGLFSYIFQGL